MPYALYSTVFARPSMQPIVRAQLYFPASHFIST